MMLPKLGGPEVLQRLKQDPLTSAVPVIVLSSLPQSNETKLMKEGAAAYLEKSALTSNAGTALVDVVDKVLHRQEVL
jgi:CheY-like chemotaxis protein